MTIKYDYMEDGTPFVATSINTRSSKLATQLNTLTREELGHGALRTEHLPSPIGINGEKVGWPLSSQMGSSNSDPTYTYSNGLITPLNVEFSTPVNFDDDTQSVDAILVLVNLNISHFLNSRGQFVTISPYAEDDGFSGQCAIEDQIMATFTVTYKQDAASSTVTTLPKSNRSVSPGITVSELEAGVVIGGVRPYKGRWNYICALDGDGISNKDVAIRTVIRKEDIPDLSPLSTIASVGLRVDIKFWPYATGAGVLDDTGSVVISKATLSAIPIQCRTT